MAVQRLKHKLRDAEDKQQTTRKWSRALDDRTQPLIKEVENLHTFLTVDMVRAVAHLEQVVETLEAYAAVAQPGLSTGDPPHAAQQPPAPTTGAGDPDTRHGNHR